jgi:hypothetical protein
MVTCGAHGGRKNAHGWGKLGWRQRPVYPHEQHNYPGKTLINVRVRGDGKRRERSATRRFLRQQAHKNRTDPASIADWQQRGEAYDRERTRSHADPPRKELLPLYEA